MSNWRPIETAPKDGTWVLVWFTEGPPMAFRFELDPLPDDADDGSWVGPYSDGFDTKLEHMCGEGEPTHWMPLPEPPDA